MESISLKLDENMLSNIDENLKENNYSTRTEFIRDAIRDKLDQIKRERMAEEFLKFQGKSKKQTTSMDNKKTAEKALNDLAKEMGWN